MLEKRVDKDQIWNRDYIYLDWNVIKYLKEPRENKEKIDGDVYQIILRLGKKYVFPFSEAHIEDRCNNYKEEYLQFIEDDLSFVSNLSNGYCVAQQAETKELKVIKCDVMSLFNDIMKMEKDTIDCKNLFNQMIPFRIDLQNPELDYMKEFLEGDSICNHEKLNKIVTRIFNNELANHELYKSVRNSRWIDVNIENLDNVNDIYSNMAQKHFQKMIDCIRTDDKNYLIDNWKQAVFEAVNLHYEKKEIDERNLLQTAYCMLDFNRNFRDRIMKKNNFTNIYRDSKHVWYASQAKMFVSEDKHTREKAILIYKAFGKNTVVLSMEEFRSRMEYMI